MALKPCADCGHALSSKAETCPHCGRPTHMTFMEGARTARKGGLVFGWIFVALFFSFIALAMVGSTSP